MATSKLVTLGNLALLSDVNNNLLVYASAKFVVASLNVEHLDTNDGALFAVRNLERGVANFAALLVEDCTKQTLFG